ncbi:MAG: DUF4442 domain-containing protein [Cytophagaceae bacterium]|jgi:hypothetical protein|nr:DUF4442 domain-containing protein [Cytophagaceae bacterium]
MFQSWIQFKLFLFTQLPSAWFAGLSVSEFNPERCKITIAYSWRTKNPFRSIYFACLSMAAELASGALAYWHSQKSPVKISMLVTHMEAQFVKKATGRIYFQCQDGNRIKEAIDRSIRENQPQECRTESVGINEQGEEVARFFITWSFKAKSNPSSEGIQ